MNTKDKLIKSIEKKVVNSSNVDIILSIFKTSLSLTKFSPLSTLISEFIPNRRFLRLEKFTQELAEDLNELDEKIDTEFITTDEFAFIFEQCYKAASENYQKDKLDAFKSIILNSAVNKNISNEKREFYLNLTNSLTVLHIKILKFMHSPYDYLSENNLDENIVTGGFSNFFPAVFPEIGLETIKIAFEDLHNYGLISSDKGIFHTMTVSGGFQLLGDRVSKSGKDYINFITNV